MKTRITLIALLLISSITGLKAQDVEQAKDTTKITIKGKKIIIIDSDSTNVWIGDDADDDKKDKKKGDDITHFKGLYLGIAGLRNPKHALGLSPSQVELNYGRSFNWQINLFEKSVPIASEYIKLSTGLGFNLNSYQIENNLDLIKTPNGVAEIPNTTVNYDKNKLRVGYVTVPLMLGFSTSKDQEKGVKLAAGIQGGYKIQGNVKRKYEQNGETFKPKYRSDLHMNDFTYSLIGRLALDKICVYAEYSMQSLFEKGKAAQEMYPFSIGIRLVDFN